MAVLADPISLTVLLCVVIVFPSGCTLRAAAGQLLPLALVQKAALSELSAVYFAFLAAVASSSCSSGSVAGSSWLRPDC